jgi:hypothetical protein
MRISRPEIRYIHLFGFGERKQASFRALGLEPGEKVPAEFWRTYTW